MWCWPPLLLHDVLEDTAESAADLRDTFGDEICEMVESLTKLDRLKLATPAVRQVSALRKMLISMSNDMRVLIIKFADRLHNMTTLAALSPERQQRVATETMQVYVPLAERLGMESVKNHLEDLAFAVLHPKWYGEIDHLVEERAPERELHLTQVIAQISTRLTEVLVNAEVTGRPKHLWSIFDKMQKKQLEFDEIYDLVGIRIIVDSVQDCYAALGTVHAIWKPAQGRFKDYISMPKFNLYQSLHTTVAGPGGKLLEVQIRTHEMHRRAEYGVAAHWDYKEESPTEELLWLSRLMDWTEDSEEADASLARLTADLALEEVYVFHPPGHDRNLAGRGDPGGFRLRHPHRGGAQLHWRQDRRALVGLELQAEHRPDSGGVHQQARRGCRAVAGLAGVRDHPQGAQQHPPVARPQAAPRGRCRPRQQGG